ncbi:MAG: 1-acyl-sn-glycerol-3-phosphate acyltransferase [Pseudomonadales bacterium]|nr:1-acyl-sn-glycerol-3-phosphate acyltransferase [Pseudomonadales bacterium]MBO6597719.1 1-acyl-sn-glycerol-3-phosphate acyltransferase [Pseudomonadales bacterium]MBO6657909.1 1-acyl-sn-glycerol-3-phosphate acyltransferase [Pseudomonadales bacterium]MBO6704034.1 1-acyl-sn-glycerol-3-phosphate acyltransferase [Pseudomonadales bacterium]MBO6823957.1 1-acyl-sn-glycerol-3-phosphate acyltransferase [Pseudomonadales bacterium]
MSDFEDIRPYHDHEVSGALEQLAVDPELIDFLSGWLAPRTYRIFPGLLRSGLSWYLKRSIRGVNDIAGFQNVVAAYALKLVREGTTEFSYEGFDRLVPGKAYLFISNHRDIAGDSMLLDYALYLNDLHTVRIAIGDNLVQREFATSLMRLNKGFFIKRSAGGPRKAYAALLQSSQYIKHSIETGNSIWIAQSEGRSKDGLDVTDPAIIKMFVLADRKKPLAEAIRDLNIVPLSISYEFDPCDVLKATEVGRIAKEGGYEKPPGEDLLSLVRGLSGKKGRVILRLGEELNGDFETPEEVAAEVDRQIIGNLELFPVNHWALAKLQGEGETVVSKQDALELTQRLKTCPPEYRSFWLQMYANPVLNRARILGEASVEDTD